MKDLRTQKSGRRDYEQSREYFSRDSYNQSTAKDRRRVPDRRTDNIEVNWIDEDLQIFS